MGREKEVKGEGKGRGEMKGGRKWRQGHLQLKFLATPPFWLCTSETIATYGSK